MVTKKPVSEYTEEKPLQDHQVLKGLLFAFRYGSMKQETWPEEIREMHEYDIKLVEEAVRRRKARSDAEVPV